MRLTPLLALPLLACVAHAQVVISEIHYHPYEKSAFQADGTPVLDLSEDVHEFVKLHNAGASEVDLSGWKLAGGIDFTFPAGAKIAANGYRVVAKNPARLAAVYAGLTDVLGPFEGQLGNGGDTVELENAAKMEVDTVTYDSRFPWAISANELGAGEDWTLLDYSAYQYKGRSLQRVSATWSGDDPANWLASPPIASGAGGPNPGGPNAVTRPSPKPVVTALFAVQENNASRLIRPDQAAKIVCSFSPGQAPRSPQVEYWVDDIEVYDEARTIVAMTALPNGQFTASLPAQPTRKVVRYRILGDRGDGVEVISPRADDPAVVPTGAAAREAWHAYFVTPERNQTGIPRPIYDCFASKANMTTLNRNITQSPKRVTKSSPQAFPREVPYVAANAPLWNGTVPAIFVHDGKVHDIQFRHHGSRYNRNSGRNSFKVQFLEYQPFQGRTSNFITDKQDIFITTHGLFRAANLPVSAVQWVEWYFNNNSKLNRLEQGEFDGDELDDYHKKMERITPGAKREATGEYYKSVGTLELPEGPYGRGDEGILAPIPAAAGAPGWTPLQRYEYTYALQNHGWKGPKPVMDMIETMWKARGNTDTKKPPESIPVLRKWFEENYDVEATLRSMTLLNWMCPWDDTTQNHFVWRRANGRWCPLPWDFDAMYGTGDNVPATASIYIGEIGDKNNNSRGPNFMKDGVIKCFRDEFDLQMWTVVNTLLDPENLDTLTYATNAGTTRTFRSQIGAFVTNRSKTVHTKLAKFGVYFKPKRPVNALPAANASVMPGAILTASEYAHTNADAPKGHASTRWEIRRADKTYDDPEAVEVSADKKTSWAIPFDKLRFGQAYFWRAIHVDAEGHPSVASAETAFTYGSLKPSGAGLLLSEVLTDNRTTVANNGKYPDYVEIWNTTSEAISLEGKTLTDDPLQPARFKFPAGASVPANGFLVVWCDTDTAAPGPHTGFALDRGGQRLILLNGAEVLDTIAFGPQSPDLALSRFGQGSEGDAWGPSVPTPGKASAEKVALGDRSKLVINEWMAAPAEGQDWFELYNAGDAAVSLDGLFLSDAFGKPTTTKLPPLSFLKAKGHVRITADGTNDGFARANFKLSGLGDNIVLTEADGVTVITAVVFGPQTAGVAQGRQPDGSSNIVAFPGAATPGEPNPAPTAGDSDGDGLPDAYETANGLDAKNAADAVSDQDGDGQSARAEFLAGTDPRDAGSVFRASVSDGNPPKLKFTARSGKAYSVEVSENLRSGSWTKLRDVPAEAADRAVEVELPKSSNRRFFRAVTPPRS